jgi:hypothetical protein
MSERTTTTTTHGAPGAADRSVPAPPDGGSPAAAPRADAGPVTAVPEPPAPVHPVVGPVDDATADDQIAAAATADRSPGVHVTAPVTVRPKVRGPRRGPLTRMGPWAPVAGALVGLLGGVVVAVLLAGAAADFADRLALVLTVVGLGMLGAAGTLLADEVRMIRQGAREAAVRPAWVEATAPLLSGLTPARLLLLVSAFVLFLAAYVAR